MKNMGKYKNELMDVIKKDGNICEFMIKHGVSQMFGKDTESFCGETECTSCTTALNLWLDTVGMRVPFASPVDAYSAIRKGEKYGVKVCK